MRKIIAIFLMMLFVGFGASGAMATNFDVQEYAIVIDGVQTAYWLYPGDPVDPNAPVTIPGAGTLTNGQGTLTWLLSGSGAHTFGAYFDLEIDQKINTFFNEFGSSFGTPGTGVTYQLDDPFGSIFDNTQNAALDDSNSVASGNNDVSFALGWDFNLTAGETGLVTLHLTDIPRNLPSFYLSQTDPDSQATLYYWGTLDIREGNPVPEPGTLMLLASGLVGLAGFGRRMARS